MTNVVTQDEIDRYIRNLATLERELDRRYEKWRESEIERLLLEEYERRCLKGR